MNKKFYLAVMIAMIAALSFFAVYGREQKNNAAVQSWEYKSFVIARGANVSNGAFTIWVEASGKTVKELPPPVDMPSKAQELGAQGWELISVTPVSNHITTETAGFTSQIVFWFKRPK